MRIDESRMVAEPEKLRPVDGTIIEADTMEEYETTGNSIGGDNQRNFGFLEK